MRDFALISQKGRPVFGPFFTLRVRLSKETTRVGFVASNKIFRRANKRNRAKRRLRAVLREVFAQWPAQMDLLFVLKQEVLDAPYEELRASVLRSFEKIPEALLKPLKTRPMKARRKTSVVYKNGA
jgi:ribonuclease P protein component